VREYTLNTRYLHEYSLFTRYLPEYSLFTRYLHEYWVREYTLNTRYLHEYSLFTRYLPEYSLAEYASTRWVHASMMFEQAREKCFGSVGPAGPGLSELPGSRILEELQNLLRILIDNPRFIVLDPPATFAFSLTYLLTSLSTHSPTHSPVYSLWNMLQTKLHATRFNTHHSFRGLLRIMLHTCFIAHAN